jgi:hypothetical protein
MKLELLVAVIAVVALALLGCVKDQAPASDVRGNYDVTFDDKLTITLDIGGAKQVQHGTESDVVTFHVNGQPLTLDLAQFCAKPEVQCPSEVLWTKVSIDQPNIHAQIPNSHVVNVIDNRVHDLPAGQKADAIGGLVDANDHYTLLVGGNSRGAGQCGLLALSVAQGRFTHEGETVSEVPVDGGVVDGGVVDGGTRAGGVTFPPGAPINGIAEGELRVGYFGACAFGPAIIGATLELDTGYTGTRTGALDPPPFTPVDPATVPPGADAGPDDVDGGPADAG